MNNEFYYNLYININKRWWASLLRNLIKLSRNYFLFNNSRRRQPWEHFREEEEEDKNEEDHLHNIYI